MIPSSRHDNDLLVRCYLCSERNMIRGRTIFAPHALQNFLLGLFDRDLTACELLDYRADLLTVICSFRFKGWVLHDNSPFPRLYSTIPQNCPIRGASRPRPVAATLLGFRSRCVQLLRVCRETHGASRLDPNLPRWRPRAGPVSASSNSNRKMGGFLEMRPTCRESALALAG